MARTTKATANPKDETHDSVARGAFDEKFAQVSERVAENAAHSADSWEKIDFSIKSLAPDLRDLVDGTLSSMPDALDQAAASVGTITDQFEILTKESATFEKAVMQVAPSLDKLAKGEVYDALPTVFADAVEETHSLIDALAGIDKKMGFFERFKLVSKSIGSVTPGLKQWIKPLAAVDRLRLIQPDNGFFGALRRAKKDWLDTQDGIESVNKKLAKSSIVGAAAAGAGTFAAKKLSDIMDGVQEVFFQTWSYIDKKAIPTEAMLNKELGGTGTALGGIESQALRTGDRFWEMGLSFEQGTKAVGDIASGLQTVNISNKSLESVLKLSEYVGVGAKEASALANQFIHAEGSLNNFNSAMKDAVRSANEFQVPVQGLRKEFSENIDLMARFGTENYHAFNTSIAKAHQYGLTMKEVDGAFGKSLDTFKGTSDAAAKLNTVFGSSINSLEVLQEQDPTKRMLMISKALANAGVTNFGKLNRAQQNVITENLHINESQASLLLSGEKGRKMFEAQAKAEGKAAKSSQDWDKALGRLRNTLLNKEAEFSKLFRAISEGFAKFLGLDNAREGAEKGARLFKDILANITDNVNHFVEKMPKGGASDLMARFEKFALSIEKAANALGRLADLFGVADKEGQKFEAGIFDRFQKIAKSTDSSRAGLEENMAFMKNFETAYKTLSDEQKQHVDSELGKRGLNKEDTSTSMSALEKQVFKNRQFNEGAPSSLLRPDSQPKQEFRFYLDGKELKSRVVAGAVQ